MADTPLVHLSAAQAAIARANGHTVYSLTQELCTADWQMNLSAGPSGLIPDATPTGYHRALWDDFTLAGYNTTEFNPPYDGTSQASQNGKFDALHTVVNGDSLLRLQMKPDPTVTIANGWAGAGIQTKTRFPVNTIYQFAMRSDSLSGATPIALTMGNNWPPEIDIFEGGASFIHYGQGNANRPQFTLPALDWTKWHRFKCSVTSANISMWVDGTNYCNIPNPSPVTDAYGLQYPMFLSLQYQTGDPNNPPVGTGTYEMQVDWVAIDTIG